MALIGEDESIWGIGHKVQGRGLENCVLRKIERPANCVGYKKVVAGKFQRYVLTESGLVFCNGENKRLCGGRDLSTLEMTKKFNLMTFPIEEGDKIVDISGGRHFMLVTT